MRYITRTEHNRNLRNCLYEEVCQISNRLVEVRYLLSGRRVTLSIE